MKEPEDVQGLPVDSELLRTRGLAAHLASTFLGREIVPSPLTSQRRRRNNFVIAER